MRGQILGVWQNWTFLKEGFHPHSIVFCEYSTFYVQIKNNKGLERGLFTPTVTPGKIENQFRRKLGD